tara:strand:- start:150 stop:497 length:348 start_codon:yes stop_codon:yes gene_type:complete
MGDKIYKTISEVAKILNVNIHVIRYWDSKLGISQQSNTNKKKFFNSSEINKLKKLKNTLYHNGKYNYSLDLAKNILNNKVKINNNASQNKKEFSTNLDIDSLKDIRKNLIKLLNI